MKPHWDDLETVLTLVQSGSLAGAADRLGVNYTTVARRISRIEAALGQILFVRLAGGYEPTEMGRMVAEHAQEMQQNEGALLRRLKGLDPRLSGPLVVTAPQLLLAHVLPKAIKDFSQAHPDVDLQVRATSEILDLTRREADLAIRVSNSPGDALMGQRLTAQHTAVFAAQSWLEQIEMRPKDPVDWIFYTKQQGLPEIVIKQLPASRVRYRFDDMIAMAGAAVAGLGLVRMPMYLGRKTTGLVQVPNLPCEPYGDIWIVGHKDVWRGAKPQAFRNSVQRCLKAEREVFTA